MLEGKIDLRDVERGFAGLLRAGQDIAPLLREAKRPLKADQREHQRDQRGPDGPWPKRRVAGRNRGRKRRSRRRLLGKLPRLLTIRIIGGDTLVARSKVVWAAIHQFGGRAGRGARIPARPFLYFSRQFIDDIEQALAEYLAQRWRR